MARRPTKRVDPKALFDHAEAHRQSRQLLNTFAQTLEPGPPMVGYMRSALIISALSNEIFLKCIYTIENDGFLPETNVHALDKLFYLLSHSAQNLIEIEWDRMITLSPILQASRNKFGIKIDLKSSLDAGAKAFIQYRYAYEGEALSGYGLGNLSEVLCNVIAIDKPEWGPTFDWPPLPDINWSNDRGM